MSATSSDGHAGTGGSGGPGDRPEDAISTRQIDTAGDARSYEVALPEKLDRDFWAKVADGRWERETYRLFDARLGPGRRLVDIGAWIGPTVLHAAALGAEVTAFEPDPVALGKLRRNLGLNRTLAERVELVGAALDPAGGDADGFVTLASEELGNSMSGQTREAAETARVPALSPVDAGLDALIAGADLVKLDIEGGEFALLPALAAMLRQHRPVLQLSLHAVFLPETMPAERRRALQEAALDAVSFYPVVYRAERGAWHRLENPWDSLRAEIAGDGLTVTLALADAPLSITD